MLLQGPRLGPWLPLPMILLWLFCAGVTGQEPCSSPGDFPSPTLSLSTTSAQVGDSVLAQCSLRLNNLAALVIFCQDGKEISSQLTIPGQSLYHYVISVQSSGHFRCMYQYWNNQNQVNNSRLSLPRTLNVTGRKLIPNTVPSPEDPPSQEGPAMSVYSWILRSTLVLLLLVSAPIITNVLERTSHCSV